MVISEAGVSLSNSPADLSPPSQMVISRGFGNESRALKPQGMETLMGAFPHSPSQGKSDLKFRQVPSSIWSQAPRGSIPVPLKQGYGFLTETEGSHSDPNGDLVFSLNIPRRRLGFGCIYLPQGPWLQIPLANSKGYGDRHSTRRLLQVLQGLLHLMPRFTRTRLSWPCGKE